MLRNKLRYLLLIASFGLLSILYNEYFMGIIFLTILIMPILLFGLLCYLYSQVSAELITVIHIANKDELIPVSVQFNNTAIFPVSNLRIYLTYKNTFSPRINKQEFLISLDRKCSTTMIFNLRSEYAGNLEVSLEGIRIYDYLKLFSFKKKLKGQIKTAVLPTFHEIPENYIVNRSRSITESDNYSAAKSGDDPSEVFAIREYQEGDRLQRIHWKLSRKQNQLMIKEFSDPMNCSVLLFADLCIPDGNEVLPYMDALLESILSLSYSFLLKGQIHYFTWFDRTHGSCRRVRIDKEKDFYEAVDGLMQAAPYTENTDAVTAYLAEHPNEQYTDLFYVTGKISENRMNLISLIKCMTVQAIVIVGSDETKEEPPVDKKLAKYSNEMGIGLSMIDLSNVKNDIEQLKLG